MSTKTQHDWLRRVSDYHSGGVSAAEAAAVEEHLAGCEECREALVVYRRFYVLASSPLQLGEPSSVVAEQPSMLNVDSDRFTDGERLEHHPHHTTPPERSRRLLGIASVLAASLIIVGFLSVLGPRIGTNGKHTTPTPRPSATPSGPTPTVQTTNVPVPGSGYTNAGPDWATNLAFASSSPTIVYACGIVASNSGEILVAVSMDGGHTWQSQASPGNLPGNYPAWLAQQLRRCTLTVDPTNPRDLALLGEQCSDLVTSNSSDQCETTTTQLYRSFDAGKTWTLVNTPGGDWINYQFAWVGSDLFIGTTEGIARSIADDRFTLLQQSFFGSGSQATSARSLFVIGNTLIVQDIECTGDVGADFCAGPTARSDDRGAHWSLMPMTYRSTLVSLVVVGADGKTLIGMEDPTIAIQIGSYHYLRSVDGGATWSPLPPLPDLPNGSTDGGPLAEAPDGTIFAVFEFPPPSSGFGTSTLAIYELAPGAENWRYFAPSSGGYPRAFLWNSSGHLAVIWGDRGSPSMSGFQYRLF